MTPYTKALFDAVWPALESGDAQAAMPLLKLALEANARDPYFHYALGNCQFRAGDIDDAAVALTTATRLDPKRAEAFNDLAATLFVLGRDAEALVCLRRALDLDPSLPEATETDAIWLLRYGQFHEGWQKYESRFRTRANRHLRRDFAQPAWTGEPLNGCTILLHAEQGLGDALQFVRYAPLVARRGGRVVLEVYPQVLPLVRHLPGVALAVSNAEPLPPFDVHCSLLSLPGVFDTDLDSIPATVPYLTVPPDKLAEWTGRLGPRRGMRVGIAWSGNPRHRDDARRSIPFETFHALTAAHPAIEFHSLQKDVSVTAANVFDHSAELHDFGDTGALVSLMDLVISVDTSVAHLAGALGRPVWVLLMHLADWRWLLEREDSPWYPTMRLLRQPSRGDWASVLAKASRWLEAL